MRAPDHQARWTELDGRPLLPIAQSHEGTGAIYLDGIRGLLLQDGAQIGAHLSKHETMLLWHVAVRADTAVRCADLERTMGKSRENVQVSVSRLRAKLAGVSRLAGQLITQENGDYLWQSEFVPASHAA